MLFKHNALVVDEILSESCAAACQEMFLYCLLQGGKYFTGHWFYSLWNTSLVVTTGQSHGRIKQEDPVSLEPHRIFRASDHDNSIYAGHSEHGNTQSLQTITKYVSALTTALTRECMLLVHTL